MKRLFPILATICLFAGIFTSCSPALEFDEIDLFGKWKTESEVAPESDFQYCVFLSDKDDTGEYYLGKMWDEGDDVKESDLTYLGNGWFKWKLTGDELMEIHLMENGGAEVPKYYTITVLSETTLTYEDGDKSITWTK